MLGGNQPIRQQLFAKPIAQQLSSRLCHVFGLVMRKEESARPDDSSAWLSPHHSVALVLALTAIRASEPLPLVHIISSTPSMLIALAAKTPIE